MLIWCVSVQGVGHFSFQKMYVESSKPQDRLKKGTKESSNDLCAIMLVLGLCLVIRSS